MVLAQTQIHINRSVEQNREHRNTAIHLWPKTITKKLRIYNGKKSVQQVVVAKLDSHVEIDEVRTYPLIIHKNKFKMAYSLKHNM